MKKDLKAKRYTQNDYTRIPFNADAKINYRNKQGEFCQLTVDEFKQLTGAIYIEDSFMTEDYYHEHLAELIKDNYQHAISKLGLSGEASDSKLCLSHVQGQHEFVGLGITANCDIGKNEIISKYCGRVELESERPGSPTYVWDNCNGAEYRNLAAMFNHSFPNAHAVTLMCDGIKQVYFFALENIKKGEAICVNYNRQNEELGQHAELRYEAVKQYVRAEPKPKRTTILSETARIYWPYIIKNPSNLLLLYFDELLTVKQVEDLLSHLKEVDLHILIPSEHRLQHIDFGSMLLDGITRLDSPLCQLKQNNPGLYKEIHEYFLVTSYKVGALAALYALEAFANCLLKKNKQCMENHSNGLFNADPGAKQTPLTISRVLWQQIRQELDAAAQTAATLISEETTSRLKSNRSNDNHITRTNNYQQPKF